MKITPFRPAKQLAPALSTSAADALQTSDLELNKIRHMLPSVWSEPQLANCAKLDTLYLSLVSLVAPIPGRNDSLFTKKLIGFGPLTPRGSPTCCPSEEIHSRPQDSTYTAVSPHSPDPPRGHGGSLVPGQTPVRTPIDRGAVGALCKKRKCTAIHRKTIPGFSPNICCNQVYLADQREPGHPLCPTRPPSRRAESLRQRFVTSTSNSTETTLLITYIPKQDGGMLCIGGLAGRRQQPAVRPSGQGVELVPVSVQFLDLGPQRVLNEILLRRRFYETTQTFTQHHGENTRTNVCGTDYMVRNKVWKAMEDAEVERVVVTRVKRKYEDNRSCVKTESGGDGVPSHQIKATYPVEVADEVVGRLESSGNFLLRPRHEPVPREQSEAGHVIAMDLGARQGRVAEWSGPTRRSSGTGRPAPTPDRPRRQSGRRPLRQESRNPAPKGYTAHAYLRVAPPVQRALVAVRHHAVPIGRELGPVEPQGVSPNLAKPDSVQPDPRLFVWGPQYQVTASDRRAPVDPVHPALVTGQHRLQGNGKVSRLASDHRREHPLLGQYVLACSQLTHSPFNRAARGSGNAPESYHGVLGAAREEQTSLLRSPPYPDGRIDRRGHHDERPSPAVHTALGEYPPTSSFDQTTAVPSDEAETSSVSGDLSACLTHLTELTRAGYTGRPIVWGIIELCADMKDIDLGSGNERDVIPPTRWLFSVIFPLVLATFGLGRKSLDLRLLVGFVLCISNFAFVSCLFTFFVTSSRATKFRSGVKRGFEEEFKEGGQRNWLQVLCNSGMAMQLALLYLLDVGCEERPIDFTRDYRSSWLGVGVLGEFNRLIGAYLERVGEQLALLCPIHERLRAVTETPGRQSWAVSSATRTPSLSPPFRECLEVSTNGAVTPIGLVLSAVGGAVVGLSYYLAVLYSVDPHILSLSPPQWPLVVAGAFGGFTGSLLDSLLGATLQYSGVNEKTGCIVGCPGRGVRHISGAPVLDNHSVNLISSIATGLLLPRLANTFWP
uniref:Transmembrane protein 19 n=1 Tax=Timema douglasi TaxID=61478 RepID=A0A7R8VPY8_TIMDO|nr:unnamed protein product [Timema douglasi]